MTNLPPASNVDPAEVAKFGALAGDWWDPAGPSRTLHDLNPCRLGFIAAQCELDGARVLDVGCGGGILTESLARRAAATTGIDATPAVIDIAREHALGSGLVIDYQVATAEAFVAARAGSFDCVVAMELLEHVPDPASLVNALAALARPGGDVFLSTLNRTPLAYAQAVLAAEYVLRLLPVGTHDYRQFLRPSELAAMLRASGLEVLAIRGMRYNPLTRRAWLTPTPDVNYLVHARRE
ncbi:MAG: bifunctional 2-polyprenyl-6-hydroxyphenol methylase/3-demethylubiquinol 3-O-methyltransferase UbiG [Gammaproteobacteria bacterium]